MRALPLLLAGCAAAAAAPTKPVAKRSCASAEHRQFDFWVGDWDVTIRARESPSSEKWGEAKGTQRIESILDGCAIAEHFSAKGPANPGPARATPRGSHSSASGAKRGSTTAAATSR